MVSLKVYWGHYLQAHTRPGTRGIHYFATVLGFSGGIASLVWLDPLPVLVAVAVSYMLAISAHWFIERNQPLILVNPLWGAICDVRMCFLALTGRLADELERHNVLPGGGLKATVAGTAIGACDALTTVAPDLQSTPVPR